MQSENVEVKYVYSQGVFEFCDREGKTIKAVNLREALLIARLLSNLVCRNTLLIDVNLSHSIKPAFKKRLEDGGYDYEAIRQAIKDANRPFNRVGPHTFYEVDG